MGRDAHIQITNLASCWCPALQSIQLHSSQADKKLSCIAQAVMIYNRALEVYEVWAVRKVLLSDAAAWVLVRLLWCANAKLVLTDWRNCSVRPQNGVSVQQVIVAHLVSKLHTLCGNRKFITVFQKSLSLNSIVSHMNPVYTLTRYLRLILILFFRLYRGFKNDTFSLGFLTKLFTFSSMSFMLHVPPLSSSP